MCFDKKGMAKQIIAQGSISCSFFGSEYWRIGGDMDSAFADASQIPIIDGRCVCFP